MPPDRKAKHRKRKDKRKRNFNSKTGFDMRTEAYKLFGVDVSQIPGLMMLVLPLFSEVGRDMSRWPTVGQFISWLGLCPDNDITGGKIAWKGMRGTRNEAGLLFRSAAFGLHFDKTVMGDYLRRMKGKMKSSKAAEVATAHKIARVFYTMVKNQTEFDESIWAERNAQREKQREAKMKRQARQMGYKLVKLVENDRHVNN
jgi:hypothetical protein